MSAIRDRKPTVNPSEEHVGNHEVETLDKHSEDVGVTLLTPGSDVSKAVCMGFGVKQAWSCTRILLR